MDEAIGRPIDPEAAAAEVLARVADATGLEVEALGAAKWSRRIGPVLAVEALAMSRWSKPLELLADGGALRKRVDAHAADVAYGRCENVQRLSFPLYSFGRAPSALGALDLGLDRIVRDAGARRRLGQDSVDPGSLPRELSETAEAIARADWDAVARSWRAGWVATADEPLLWRQVLDATPTLTDCAPGAQRELAYRALGHALTVGDTGVVVERVGLTDWDELDDDARLMLAAALIDRRRYNKVETLLRRSGWHRDLALACLYAHQQRWRIAMDAFARLATSTRTDVGRLGLAWAATLADRIHDRGARRRFDEAVAGAAPFPFAGTSLIKEEYERGLSPTRPFAHGFGSDALALGPSLERHNALLATARSFSSPADLRRAAAGVPARAAVWTLMFVVDEIAATSGRQGLARARAVYEQAHSAALVDPQLEAWCLNQWGGVLQRFVPTHRAIEVRECFRRAALIAERDRDPVTWADATANHGHLSRDAEAIAAALKEQSIQGREKDGARARAKLAEVLASHDSVKLAYEAVEASVEIGDVGALASHLLTWQEHSPQWDAEICAAAIACAFVSGESGTLQNVGNRTWALLERRPSSGRSLETFDLVDPRRLLTSSVSPEEAASPWRAAAIVALIRTGKARLAREFPQMGYALEWPDLND